MSCSNPAVMFTMSSDMFRDRRIRKRCRSALWEWIRASTDTAGFFPTRLTDPDGYQSAKVISIVCNPGTFSMTRYSNSAYRELCFWDAVEETKAYVSGTSSTKQRRNFQEMAQLRLTLQMMSICTILSFTNDYPVD